MEVTQSDKLSRIAYSCYFNRSREGEQFVSEHVFSYQIAGTFTAIDEESKTHVFNPGDYRLFRRNKLIKFIKQPPEHGEFKSLSVYLDQQTLLDFSAEHGYKSIHRQEGSVIVDLKPDAFYKSFFDSLGPYEQLNVPGNEKLLTTKLKEALLILLRTNPTLQDILFDFSDPGKIDLEAFMNKNYHFNVELKRFAYLTGRSLATFKRDFEKIFHITPSRWLQHRRLQEAHYLIKEKGAAPSEVYLDLGFQDLSHFSFAFKKQYGIAPSKV
jgi:AraC-like DNA-binding protein